MVRWILAMGIAVYAGPAFAETEVGETDYARAVKAKTDATWTLEALQAERDPFTAWSVDERPVIADTVAQVRGKRYALEELLLIAVVADTRGPLAMFRSPSGFGLIVRVGDYLSRAEVRVVKIIDSRVIVEAEQQDARGGVETVQRALVLSTPEPLRFTQEE